MIPLRITTRNTHVTDGLEEMIGQRLKRLETVAPRLVHCEVRLEGPHGREREVTARIDLHLPGAEIVATGRDTRNGVAVRVAFDSVRRQLTGLVDRRHDHRIAVGAS